MHELIVVDARESVRWLETKLATFPFIKPLTEAVVGMIYQQLFDNWRKATVDIEEEFPTQLLINHLEIECPYQRDYFARTLKEFQRRINDHFIVYGVFDELAQGPYLTMKVFRGYFRFEPTETTVTSARWCEPNRRFVKGYLHDSNSDGKRAEIIITPTQCTGSDIGW